ncbi:hypothetical protein LCGC14_3047570, partial [marine sediment metagenome]
VKQLIKELQNLRENDKVYVRDYSNNKLADIDKVETTTGQICLIIY